MGNGIPQKAFEKAQKNTSKKKKNGWGERGKWHLTAQTGPPGNQPRDKTRENAQKSKEPGRHQTVTDGKG